MIRTMMLIPLVAALLACGILTGDDDPPSVVVVTPVAPVEGAEARIDDPLPTTSEETERIVHVTGELALPLYAGDSSIEEKIIEHSVIVKAAMTSVSSEVVVDADGMYSAVLRFSLDVSEYLKGTGPTSVVGVWVDGWPYETNDEANDAKANILAERDDQWDDRAAIIFLYEGASGFGTLIDGQLQLANNFLLALGDRYVDDDRYSLRSRSDKAWLPARSSAGSTGDGQEFLLDVPPATGTAPTITLGDLRTRIAAVTAELDGGDGSEAHKACVLEKYRHIRNQRNFPEERESPFTIWNINQSFVSGQPTGTVIDVREAYGVYPDTKITLRVEGRDSDLFDAADGDSTDIDEDGDGEFDTIKYDEMVNLARPVPAGEYSFYLTESWPEYALCNFDISNEWTVTAVAPEGTLHEAFFDPVTDSAAVAAATANGVLKPATFGDGDGASATIERIAWESGTVKLKVSPHTGLSGHVVDFIELDGTASLSLYADHATVDDANDTLSWSVASQPWDDGDELMVRLLRSTLASAPAQTPAETSLPTRMPAAATVPAPTPAPIPTPASAAQACNLMDTPYDALLTSATPIGEARAEIRYSGSDEHIVTTITDHESVLLGKYEAIIKDRTRYYRESAPSNPEVYGEWLVVGTDLQRSFPLPCLDTSSFEEGASGSSDEPHFTSERFLSEEEGAERNEFWADATGRPTRARRTIFPPEYDGVSNTETLVTEFTYSGYGEPNIIAAPAQADNPGLDSLGLPDCATP